MASTQCRKCRTISTYTHLFAFNGRIQLLSQHTHHTQNICIYGLRRNGPIRKYILYSIQMCESETQTHTYTHWAASPTCYVPSYTQTILCFIFFIHLYFAFAESHNRRETTCVYMSAEYSVSVLHHVCIYILCFTAVQNICDSTTTTRSKRERI